MRGRRATTGRPAAATPAAGARHLGRGPVDPRLLHHARATRPYLLLSVVLGTVTALLIVAQAWLLATAVAGAFLDGQGLGDLGGAVWALLAVVVVRAGVTWYTEVAANRSSARVKSDLRSALTEHVAALGPGGLAEGRTGDLAVLATHGIDALDGYFTRYLPQLVLAVIVPLVVLVAVLSQDWISAAIIAVTVPLIPLFMVLIGMATRHATDRRLRALQRLAGHFLDVVAGLTTLKIFGRSKAQVQTIREVTAAYRRTTMATLRLAFLSSLVLELLASVAVALVAVSVGLRLLHGHLDLRTALFVLILAPEAYLPLRHVGTSFHASADGVRAAEQVFSVLDEPRSVHGAPGPTCPTRRSHRLEVCDLSVTYAGRPTPALDGVSFVVEPGEIVALTGPSGCGKSTLLSVVLGFVAPQRGTVRIGGIDLARPRPGRLAHPRGLGAPATTPLRRVDRRQHPARPARTPTTPRCGRRSSRPVSATWSLGCRTASAPCSASGARASRPASASGSRWPGPSSATLRCSCSTSRPPASTARPRPTSWPPSGASPRVGPSSSWPTDRHSSRWPTGWSAARSGGDERLSRSRRRVDVDELRAGAPAPHVAHRPARRRATGRSPRCSARRPSAAGIALLATSGWLISRAAEHPSIAALGLAVVGVRFFAISRGLFRYGERLVGHDAAFRLLADLRVTVYQRLERLAPSGLPAFRRGDLLARLVADVDTLQDLLLRVLPPYGIALVVGCRDRRRHRGGCSRPPGSSWPSPCSPPRSSCHGSRAAWLGGPRPARRPPGASSASPSSTSSKVHPTSWPTAPTRRQLARVAAADAELTTVASATADTAGIGSGLSQLLTGAGGVGRAGRSAWPRCTTGGCRACSWR